MDVGDPDAWQGAVSQAEQNLGPLELLANIAGVISSGTDTRGRADR